MRFCLSVCIEWQWGCELQIYFWNIELLLLLKLDMVILWYNFSSSFLYSNQLDCGTWHISVKKNMSFGELGTTRKVIDLKLKQKLNWVNSFRNSLVTSENGPRLSFFHNTGTVIIDNMTYFEISRSIHFNDFDFSFMRTIIVYRLSMFILPFKRFVSKQLWSISIWFSSSSMRMWSVCVRCAYFFFSFLL